MLFKYFLSFSAYILFSFVHASETNDFDSHLTILQDSFISTLISPAMAVCEDQQSVFKADDFFKGPIPSCVDKSFPGKIPNFGYSTSTYWAKFSILNNTNRSTFFLEYAFPSIQNVELFEKDEGKIVSRLMGKNFPFNDRPVFGHNFIFPLTISPGAEKTFVVRTKTLGAVQIPLYIHTAEALIKKSQTEAVGFGIYYGFILIMAIYNLALFFFIREKSFLFYVAYILSLALLQMSLSGNAVVWLWPNQVAWNRISTVVMVGITFFCLISFSKSYLGSYFTGGKFNRYLLAILQLACLLLSLGGLFFYGPFVIKMTGLLGLLTPVIVFSISLWYARQGTSAKFFVAAVGSFLSGSALYSLKDLGIIGSNFFTENAVLLGSSMEVALFSLGLGHKIRVLDSVKKQNELSLIQMVERNKILEMENKLANLSATIARQVSHDIRSPLAALNLVSTTLKEIPEEKRLLIRNAVQRINDIANDLLSKGRQQTASSENECKDDSMRNEKFDTILLPALVDSLVSEKRIQFRDQINVRIDSDFKDSFGSFVLADSKELLRVLSNLINNSVEALPGKKGDVFVGVRGYENFIQLCVKDNGAGIPDIVLKKLGNVEVSHGKEGTSSGSGIGVLHAKKSIVSIGGQFNIRSQLGVGTTIEIELPRAKTPTWFLDVITLPQGTEVLSLDDDLTIHQIWKGRFESLHASEKNILLKNFTSAQEFISYVNSRNCPHSNQYFLIDYELLGQATTGLDVIDELGIKENVALITSRYEEPDIRRRCELSEIKLLPKALAGFVPIEIKSPPQIYDWVLIDDDEITHMSWKIAAQDQKKKYIGFRTPEEFENFKSDIDHQSKVYIDSNLGNGIKGEDIAKQIYAEGFKNLFLATGYDPESFPEMSFIKAVVGKKPPL